MPANRHPTKRCDTCAFWAHGDQYSEDYDSQWHVDDRIGACHRNAPRPTIGEFEYQLLKHIVAIAWTHVAEEDREKEFDSWEECMLSTVSWPATTGSVWCGEWQQDSRGQEVVIS